KTVLIGATSLLVLLSVVYVYGFVLLMSGGGKLHDFYVKQSGPVRPMVWSMAIQGIKERPILGYGDGNFKYVYQNYLDTRMIHLENPPWFDRVHNFTLEELISHGVLGALAMLGIFLLIVFTSFKLYTREKRFFFLFIPFVFLLHFLQLQTFFLVDSTLLLSLLFLAFLVSREESTSFTLPWPRKNTLAIQIGLSVVMLVIFIFFVVLPVQENRLIPLIKNKKVSEERLRLEKGLNNLSIDPVETMRQVSNKFMDDTVLNVKEIQKAGFTENVAEEYKIYINAFEKYVPRYEHLYRYLYEYANFINSAFIFGVDELKRGEELTRQSLEISQKYPFPYWVLSINLYLQGRVDEALVYAKEAYDLDPTIEKSKEIYETLQAHAKSKSKQKSFFYIPNF
ncbi:MAG: O-antigen ligase family protein, partial [Minisyncoccia bacterium]